MSKTTIEDVLAKHLEFQGNTDDKWYLQSSIEHYLKTGKPSGSFFTALKASMIEWASTPCEELKAEIEDWKEKYDLLDKENDYFDERFNAKDRTIEELKARISEWEELLQAGTSPAKWYQTVLNESNQRISELEREKADYKEECDRLESVAKFWQNKYQEQNPTWQPPKLDNLYTKPLLYTMKWIKASERLPQDINDKHWRLADSKQKFEINIFQLHWNNNYKLILIDLCEWLDESTPSTESSVRDIFCRGADWYRSLLISSPLNK
jgi:FtsZ-binding cell division protein ZapB